MRRIVIGITLAAMALCTAADAIEELTTASAGLVLPSLDVMTSPSMKSPSLADDTATAAMSALPSPVVERPDIYWGKVGGSGYSLNAVLQMAWKANPDWHTFAANHALAHAALVEACAFPNPELNFEYGSESSDDTGRSRSIWTLGFMQPIELPGKRRARQVEALAGFPVVQGEMAEYGNTLKAGVREAYWTVQYFTAMEMLHAKQYELTRKQYDLAKQRQELGDAGRIEVANAYIELLKSRREREVSRRRKEGAMVALNALTNGALGRDFKLSDDFPHQYTRPALDAAVRAALTMHPRVATLAAQLEQKYAGIHRQRQEWWPDLRLGGRTSKEFDGDSAAVTASVEIPLWNRNEGGVARAEAEAQKVYAQIAVAYNELRRDVETAYQQLMLAREQIAGYDEGLRDAAEEAVYLAWEQLNLGGGGYVDILLARRQLIEMQQGYIQALYDAATARAKFDMAVGR